MTDRHHKSEIESIAITGTVFIVLCAPFYIYGITKWYQLSHHLFIQKRFPKLTAFIIFLCYLIPIIGTIGRWIQSTDLTEFLLIYAGAAAMQLLYNLVNIRLFFVYLTFRQNQSGDNAQKHNLYHHAFVKFSLIFSFAIFMYNLAPHKTSGLIFF